MLTLYESAVLARLEQAVNDVLGGFMTRCIAHLNNCSGLAYVHMLELFPAIISNFFVVGRYQFRHCLGPI